MYQIKNKKYEYILQQYDNNVYQSNEDFLNHIIESKDNYKNDLMINQGRKNFTAEDIYLILKNEMNIVLIEHDQHKPDILQIIFYDYDQQSWVSNSLLFNQVVHIIAGPKSEQFRQNLKNGFKSDHTIPIIRLNQQPMEIINDKFNIEIDFKTYRYNVLTNEKVKLKPSDLAISTLHYDIADSVSEKNNKLFNEFYNTLSNHHPERKLALMQLCLAALIRYNPSKQAINLYGEAGSGKSTLLHVVKELAGGELNAIKFTYKDLLKDDALADIGRNSLLIGYDNEDHIDLTKSDDIFKSLISREPFSYFQKYEPRGVNVFNGLFVQAFNKIPRFTNKHNKAISDRLFIIQLDKRIRSTDDDIKDYHKLIINEISELARYLIDNVKAFNQFEQQENITDQLLNELNPVYHFYNDIKNSSIMGNLSIPTSHLYEMFKLWYQLNYNNYTKLSSQAVTKELSEFMDEYELINDRLKASQLTYRNQYDRYYMNNYIENAELNDTSSRYFSRIKPSENEKIQLLQSLLMLNQHDAHHQVMKNNVLQAFNNDDIKTMQIEIDKLQ